MIVVTGASGQLGRLVIEALLKKVPADQIVAAVRNPEKVSDLAACGIHVRHADYNHPDTLDSAFQGADRLLLISSSEVGRRVLQHCAVIDAVKRAGIRLIAYTSILRADTSPLPLATEHKGTEELIRHSGIPAVILRNGWYTENYLAGIPPALQFGAVLGCAGEGRISSAARADYALAAAVVLTAENPAGKIYELAGDDSYNLAEFAQEISLQSGQNVIYQNLPEADFKSALVNAGLPEGFAALVAGSEVGASKGGLFDDSHQLSRLIGRSTTPLAPMVKAVLQGLPQ